MKKVKKIKQKMKKVKKVKFKNIIKKVKSWKRRWKFEKPFDVHMFTNNFWSFSSVFQKKVKSFYCHLYSWSLLAISIHGERLWHLSELGCRASRLIIFALCHLIDLSANRSTFTQHVEHPRSLLPSSRLRMPDSGG